MIWAAFAAAILVPIFAAALSPLLAWRDWIYITAGFAGIIGLAIMLAQPLLIAGGLPGIRPAQGRRIHFWTGTMLVTAVVIHVGGLWLTSPPDVIDVLLFRSPTPFSTWGVVAMWAVFAMALLVAYRRYVLSRTWRLVHRILALLLVVCTIIHSLLIEGTMETFSKAALCALVIAATLKLMPNFWRRFR